MQADGDFKRALELQPNFLWTHYWRRTSLMKQGQYKLVGNFYYCGTRAALLLLPHRARLRRVRIFIDTRQ